MWQFHADRLSVWLINSMMQSVLLTQTASPFKLEKEVLLTWQRSNWKSHALFGFIYNEKVKLIKLNLSWRIQLRGRVPQTNTHSLASDKGWHRFTNSWWGQLTGLGTWLLHLKFALHRLKANPLYQQRWREQRKQMRQRYLIIQAKSQNNRHRPGWTSLWWPKRQSARRAAGNG